MTDLSKFKIGDVVRAVRKTGEVVYGKIHTHASGSSGVRLFTYTDYKSDKDCHMAGVFSSVTPAKEAPKISDLVKLDLDTNQTPDLPSLRYKPGKILVFLWDNTQDYTDLRDILKDHSLTYHKEASVKYAGSTSIGTFLPWYNIDDDVETYPAYCLEEFFDMDFLDLPEYAVTKPLPLKGKVLEVSLKALQALDFYYDNTFAFSRCEIPVRPSYNAQMTVKAFSWFNTTDQIAAYKDEGEVLLTPNEGIDLTPFKNNEETFSFT